MKIDGRYDRDADIAWLRFESYDPSTVVAEETRAGLREIDPATGRVVGLEYWNASAMLPEKLLRVIRTAGALTGAYPPGYLDELRDEWPE